MNNINMIILQYNQGYSNTKSYYNTNFDTRVLHRFYSFDKLNKLNEQEKT